MPHHTYGYVLPQPSEIACLILADLKPENILITVEDDKVVTDFVKAQPTHPMDWKATENGHIYVSHNRFGAARRTYLIPKIADFDTAQRGDGDRLFILPIQTGQYRAPEVMLGAGWSYSADIWSLGALMWNMLENRDLFNRPWHEKSGYNSQVHFAQMIDLLGPPPAALLKSAADGQEHTWSMKLRNARGELSSKPVDFYGGPFFDDQGRFLYPKLLTGSKRLQDTIQSLSNEDREGFVNLASKMLRWVPQERMTAKELLDHPWLDQSEEKRAYEESLAEKQSQPL